MYTIKKDKYRSRKDGARHQKLFILKDKIAQRSP